jgi:hypothetical protein
LEYPDVPNEFLCCFTLYYIFIYYGSESAHWVSVPSAAVEFEGKHNSENTNTVIVKHDALTATSMKMAVFLNADDGGSKLL